jgi:hypothetical protein
MGFTHTYMKCSVLSLIIKKKFQSLSTTDMKTEGICLNETKILHYLISLQNLIKKKVE